MAEANLNTIPGSGNQTATQSPQTAGQPAATGNNAASVQPGTASDLLRTSTGIPLSNTPVTVVNLPSAVATVAQPAPPPARHINPVLAGFSICLFIAAIILFWLTSRSDKSTTK